MYFLFKSDQRRHEIEKIMHSYKLQFSILGELTTNNLGYYPLVLTAMCNHMSRFSDFQLLL